MVMPVVDIELVYKSFYLLISPHRIVGGLDLELDFCNQKEFGFSFYEIRTLLNRCHP